MRGEHAYRVKAGLLRFIGFALTFLFLASSSQAAPSGWLIDPYRFHASVHGEFSCQECHPDIADEKHPSPQNVTNPPEDLFAPAQCEQCHDEVFEKLEERKHGSRENIDPKKYENCSRCHNVHYVLGKERRELVDQKRSLRTQCGACHEYERNLPAPAEEDVTCYGCHLSINEEEKQITPQLEKFCFVCHGEKAGELLKKGESNVPIIGEAEYNKTVHAGLSCFQCHPDSARYPHAPQENRDCLSCHTPHDAKVTASYHGAVSCEACHLQGVEPVRKVKPFGVDWKVPSSEKPLTIHHMTITDREASCKRCHVSGNKVGASTMVLPAKSVICMACHTSTWSVGDTTTIVTLIIFGIGLISAISFWLSGSISGISTGGVFVKLWLGIKAIFLGIFSARFGAIVKALVVDGIFLRRLWKESPGRWAIHGLIFYPFVVRFLWGMYALLGSLWAPSCPLVWSMMDKNDPATAFFFDFTGLCVIAGIVLAVIRGLRRTTPVPEGLGQDRIAQGLLGAAIILGFILEGMRMAMTHVPASIGQYAFIGYVISKLFSGEGLNGFYGYLWYLHAIVWAAFLCYLPFSRMFHIILAPVVLAMNAGSKHEHGHKADSEH